MRHSLKDKEAQKAQEVRTLGPPPLRLLRLLAATNSGMSRKEAQKAQEVRTWGPPPLRLLRLLAATNSGTSREEAQKAQEVAGLRCVIGPLQNRFAFCPGGHKLQE